MRQNGSRGAVAGAFTTGNTLTILPALSVDAATHSSKTVAFNSYPTVPMRSPGRLLIFQIGRLNDRIRRPRRVTAGMFTYVAIDAAGRPQPVERGLGPRA